MMTNDERDAQTAKSHASKEDDPYTATPITFSAGDVPGGPGYRRANTQGALVAPPGYWRKFITGSVIFVGGSYALILALTYASLRYPALGLGGYIQPPKANVFLLSGLTWENLIFFIVIIGLWLLVQRLGLMPRPTPYTPQPGHSPSGLASSPFGSQNEFSRNHSSQTTGDTVTETSDASDDRRQ